MAGTIKWHKLADSRQAIPWQANHMALVEVAGKQVTLVSIGKQVYACAGKCPHASGRMSDGYIDATGSITCPLHRYKFSLINGRNVSGEGYYLKIYAIEEREAGLFIGFEENNWNSLFS